jgi:cysteine desulfurase family protein
MAYFDNAATTYPKPECVYQKMDEFYRSSGASVGRGNYKLAQSAASLIGETRMLIQELLHCPAKQVVFEPTATIALNIIIQGIVQTGISNVYTSPFEHNAVTRTLHHFEKKGVIKVYQLAVSDSMQYDLERIRYQFDTIKPELVIISHASNVVGLVAPVEDIFILAKKYNAVTLVDMAQTAGLVDLNVGLSTIDFAVFAGHKTLYGPTGISGFVMNPIVKFPAILFGGTGYESANQDMPESIPQKYEMGTLNISGIAGLNAALKWEREETIKRIWQVEQEHRERLVNLLEQYPFIKIIGNKPNNKYVGIVSALIEGISSDSAGPVFDHLNIAVRTGLQCAPLAHKFLGTYPAGTIRFSVGYFTSNQDFDDLEKALQYINDNI